MPPAQTGDPGHRLGHYAVLEQIGSGGMGEVFSALRSDGQFDQKVAIKLVRSAAASGVVLEHFRNERQILAGLDHPNIARLLDGGTTEDGTPYIVMELVTGLPIDDYCDAHKLSISGRLGLFRQVCAAVQYAHQHLIVHRDLKPANILVTEDGTPKLLDFGIARIFDSSGVVAATQYRSFTPDYASPEQLRGDPLTTSTDLYSLGVVLYRLLTGRSPYRVDPRMPAKLVTAITKDEPARPSMSVTRLETMKTADGIRELTPEFFSENRETTPLLLQKRLRGDLDYILLKALRKEPQLRYSSVEQLSEDIRRHLEGRPVSARQGTWNYRAGKFLRRNRAAATAAGLVAATLVAGLVVTTREIRVAEANRRKADARFNDVRQLSNFFLFEFDNAIRDLPGSTPVRSLVVKRGLEYLDRLASESRGDASLQMEIASAYNKVGEVQGDPLFPNLGDSQGALESSRKALAILEALSQVDPQNRQVRLALASTHSQFSDVLDFAGDTASAVGHSRNALAIYEGLAPALLTDPKFQGNFVTQMYRYANLLRIAGVLDEAATQYARAVALSRQILAANPSNNEGKIHLAASLDGLGNILQEKGDTVGALENRRAGLAIREELVNSDPNNAHYRRQLAFSHHNVGLSLVEAGELPQALAQFRQELALFESLSSADPKDVQGRRNRSLAHKQIGDTLMRSGDIQGGLKQYRAALSIDSELVSTDPGNNQAILDLSFSEGAVGSAMGRLGRTPAALQILRSGIQRQESLFAKDPGDVLMYSHLANSYTKLADGLSDSGQTISAIEYYRKAVAARLTLSEKSPASGANRRALAECYTNLAKALGTGHPDEALKQFGNAIALLDRLLATDQSRPSFRAALADALAGTARIYAHMAEQDGLALQRVEHCTKARSFYQRSRQLWLELERSGKVPLARRSAVKDLSIELTRCNDVLASLQQAH